MKTAESSKLIDCFEIHTTQPTSNYVHRLLQEKDGIHLETLSALKPLIDKAHEDVKKHLRKVLLGTSLDPIASGKKDPAEGYPERLEITTLKGYFGEILAGFVAANFEHFGHTGWVVPAFLFRFHHTALQMLGLWQHGGAKPGIIPGRTGEDCVAFLCSEAGEIVASIMCEAKCTGHHDPSMISESHKQVSKPDSKLGTIGEIIEVLMGNSEDPTSIVWIERLRDLYQKDITKNYTRYDLVSYTYSSKPTRSNTRIPTDKPHAAYAGQRKLEAVELYISNIEAVIGQVYGVKHSSNVSTKN